MIIEVVIKETLEDYAERMAQLLKQIRELREDMAVATTRCTEELEALNKLARRMGSKPPPR